TSAHRAAAAPPWSPRTTSRTTTPRPSARPAVASFTKRAAAGPGRAGTARPSECLECLAAVLPLGKDAACVGFGPVRRSLGAARGAVGRARSPTGAGLPQEQ